MKKLLLASAALAGLALSSAPASAFCPFFCGGGSNNSDNPNYSTSVGVNVPGIGNQVVTNSASINNGKGWQAVSVSQQAQGNYTTGYSTQGNEVNVPTQSGTQWQPTTAGFSQTSANSAGAASFNTAHNNNGVSINGWANTTAAGASMAQTLGNGTASHQSYGGAISSGGGAVINNR